MSDEPESFAASRAERYTAHIANAALRLEAAAGILDDLALEHAALLPWAASYERSLARAHRRTAGELRASIEPVTPCKAL